MRFIRRRGSKLKSQGQTAQLMWGGRGAFQGLFRRFVLAVMVPSVPGGLGMKTILAALGLALALSAPAKALEPVRAGQEAYISRAVFADGKLWVLSDSGQLFTITEGKEGREKVATPEDVVDLWLKGGKVAIVTCWGKHCARWTLRVWQGAQWQTVGSVQSERLETLDAVAEADSAILLLTDKRLIELRDGVQSAVSVQSQNPIFGISTILVRPGRVLVGLNRGEWGGGLYAIDRKSGRTRNIESNTSHSLCGGPLNTGCDPVNGLVPEPGKPGCILAAVGLVHLGPHGRIVEICGETVKRHYFRNLPCIDLPKGQVDFSCLSNETQDGEKPLHTEAFFGLVRSGADAWAVGVDGLYKITPKSVERFGGLPKFTNYGGTYASFAIPGIVLVLTEINGRQSLSGATPLIVPREGR
jgi:hypothetical protein